MLVDQYLLKSQSYEAYFDLMKDYAQRGLTSGPHQSDSFIHYTKLNFSRMKRMQKLAQKTNFSDFLNKPLEPIQLLAITETWCGDAAPTLPFINELAKSLGWPELRITWRDEHPELIEKYHTNGSWSIPKVLFINAEKEVIGNWGPRPKELQDYVVNTRNTPGFDKEALSEYVQRWYNADKGISTVKEVLAIANELPVTTG